MSGEASSEGPGRTGLRGVAYGLRFVLELLLLVALVYAGAALLGGVTGWLAGALAALVAAVVWGQFVAPRAASPPRVPARLAIEVALFGCAAVGLVVAGRLWLGVGLAGLYILDRLAIWASGAPPFETATR